MDIALMRMQYEILNVPVNKLAEASGISAAMIQNEIDSAGWKQIWPNEPSLANPDSLQNSYRPVITDSSEIDETEDHFLSSSADLIERSRRRLQVYSLAKETMLATRYLELENGIISAAIAFLNNIQVSKGQATASDLKDLAQVFKAITNGSTLSSGSIQFGTDDNGLPTVIYKDLSGKR